MTRTTPTPPPSVYPRAWAAWAVATAASFAALEAAALATRTENGTLSAQLRRRRRVSATLVAVGAAWLIHHIAIGGQNDTPGAATGVDDDGDGMGRDWSWR